MQHIYTDGSKSCFWKCVLIIYLNAAPLHQWSQSTYSFLRSAHLLIVDIKCRSRVHFLLKGVEPNVMLVHYCKMPSQECISQYCIECVVQFTI